MNDPKLKLTMARLLPEKVVIRWEEKPDYSFMWKDNLQTILETEWLYVMYLIEEQLTQGQLCAMSNELDIMHELDGKPYDASQWKHHKSFNQRAAAMCRVKGIDYATN